MGGRQPLDRLTASDLFLAMWDDYGWSSDIGGLAVLDGSGLITSDGQLRVDVVRERVEQRLHLVPRFRQLLLRPGAGRGWPVWVDAPSFDVADHVRVEPVAAPGDGAELLSACERIARLRLDPTRPLWELWLLPGLPEHRVGAYLRLHHAIADGEAAVAAFGALLDVTPDAPSVTAAPWQPAALPTDLDLVRDNVVHRWSQAGGALAGLTHPARTWSRSRAALPAWREVLTEEPAPQTSLNHPVGDGRRLAVARADLQQVKQVAHAYGAKVNDVVLAAVAGGLRELLTGRGEDVDGLVQRAMVTISLHDEQPGRAQGNKPGWMMVPLPVGEPDPVRRLQQIATQTAVLKDKDRPQAGSGIFRFAVGQRLWYRSFPRQRAVNIVVSNAVGPSVPLYLAGARLLEMFPMMPTMGNLTLVVAALSYCGELTITAAADRDLCSDVAVFTRAVGDAMTALARSLEPGVLEGAVS